MHDVRLKRVEKNEILSLVEGVGLNPQEFEWLEDDSNEYIDGESMRFRAYTLRHRPTDYYCKFGGFRVEFSPGPIRRVEADQHHNNWDIKRAVAQLWLEELQKEANAPDLWATIGQEKALSTAASSASLDNRPFSAVEQTLIATKLDEIKEYLLEGPCGATPAASARAGCAGGPGAARAPASRRAPMRAAARRSSGCGPENRKCYAWPG